MAWTFTPFMIPLIAAGIALPLLAVYLWNFRPAPALIPAIILLLGTAFWSNAYALELAGVDIVTKLFWAKVKYTGIVTVPVGWLAFGLEYSGRSHWLTRRTIPLLLIHPILILALLWTNDSHHLIWANDVFLDTSGPVAVLGGGYGPMFLVHSAYTYFLFLVGSVFLFGALVNQPYMFRLQGLLMLLGLLAPWVGNITYLSGLTPIHGLDITPYTFSLSALALASAVLQFRMLDVMPVARNMAVDTMTDLMLVLDARGRVVDLNSAAQATFDLPLKTIVGIEAEQAFHHHPALAKRLAPGALSDDSEVEINQNGSRLIFDLDFTPLNDAVGRETGQMIIMRDITGRKQAEETIREVAAQLEEQNRELDAFAHTVAHDLKNPLSLLVGYADLINLQATSEKDADIRLGAQRIAETTLKMNGIIDALLMLASVRNKDEVQVDPLQMDAIVSDALSQLRGFIEKNNAEIIVAEVFPEALGFAPWIEEVWTNTISNAIKYGGTPPHVEIGGEVQPGGMARFWVKDNGHGLTPEQQEKLFIEFSRLKTKKADGHGLGLSIIKRIVEKLGGEVGVESAVGTGSTFWFTLPHPD